ncbi:MULTISPECIES: hybrid sensor histidine kinase/response regulator [unclassified Streptomyces]|uniref:ATP-binding response regulator n=1 Tax=unclassified Streptomyces TaxID=2593676 RepID=UPI000DB926D7|nr:MULTISPECIES: hybrid sensor histidine kinase/response regulator [unclassified Streptomyces]MYT73824.1 response regulator [Streptomyces sp. SID8367]RAJ89237.1 signal transduction histidine kinase [Streptomyces sp. PsTaAH-137]
MNGAPVAYELYATALDDQQSVLMLRRCLQAVCRAAGVRGQDLVRMVTVLSEAGQDLLRTPGLSGHLGLAVVDHGIQVEARLAWTEPRTLSPRIAAAAGRLLDAVTPDLDGRGVLFAQRTPLAADRPDEAAAACRTALHTVDGVDLEEVLRLQNRNLLAALDESRGQQEELTRLNAELEETNSGVVAMYSELSRELEETNTGVVALYAELEDKSRQLRLASQSKTRFWANVSHELRSPINSVIALARLLLAPDSPELTPEQRQQITMISASGTTMLALVEELLDVAKAESGRLDPHCAPVDLRTLHHLLRGTMQGMTREGVRLRIDDPQGECTLVTDEVILTRVLRNVLSNALKFTEHGEVGLTFTRERRGDRDWCVWTVHDTGVGIPEDQLEKVFEEFYQVRGVHQRGRAGTGLGLPYARRLTGILGGRLTLTSRPGHGTRATVELPALPPAPTPAAPSPRLPIDSLVVVDDDPASLAALRPALRELARRHTEVTDSGQALETIRRTRPDAVLLDLMMPSPDGYALLSALDADPDTRDLPVAVLSSADLAEIDRARLRGRTVLPKARATAAALAAALFPDAGPAPGAEPGKDAPRP